MKKFRPDWFTLGMLGAMALAWAFPEPGASGGWMHPELVTDREDGRMHYKGLPEEHS